MVVDVYQRHKNDDTWFLHRKHQSEGPCESCSNGYQINPVCNCPSTATQTYLVLKAMYLPEQFCILCLIRKTGPEKTGQRERSSWFAIALAQPNLKQIKLWIEIITNFIVIFTQRTLNNYLLSTRTTTLLEKEIILIDQNADPKTGRSCYIKKSISCAKLTNVQKKHLPSDLHPQLSEELHIHHNAKPHQQIPPIKLITLWNIFS